MATRANIELYDSVRREGEGLRAWRKGAMLYHPLDGYPEYMGPALEGELEQIRREMERESCPGWGNSEQVGALLVTLATDRSFIPAFVPCLDLHPEVDYLWRVFLDQESWAYEIQCFGVLHDLNNHLIRHLERVYWRDETGL